MVDFAKLLRQMNGEEPTPPKPTRIVIAGSRDFCYPEYVTRYVELLPLDWIVMSGGARGVDTWAEEAARNRGMQVEVYPADWERLGKRAGIDRNYTMAIHMTWATIFWDGQSRGTAHMLQLARESEKLRHLFVISHRR